MTTSTMHSAHSERDDPLDADLDGLSPAQRTLVDVHAYYKNSATRFEAEMWTRLIEEVGDVAVQRYLMAHVQRSPFAPKISEAMQALRPGANNAAAAFEQLSMAVASVGPYRAPTFADEAIAHAVHRLGGWVAVCEQMPAPDARFDREAYAKRFEVAYQAGSSSVMLAGPRPEPLRGLHAISNDARALALELSRQALSLQAPQHEQHSEEQRERG